MRFLNSTATEYRFLDCRGSKASSAEAESFSESESRSTMSTISTISTSKASSLKALFVACEKGSKLILECIKGAFGSTRSCNSAHDFS